MMGLMKANEFNERETENGAIGYATTNNYLLDLNFAATSLRQDDFDKTSSRFMRAYEDNPELALKWLFFLRDVREGMGERKIFRALMTYLAYERSYEIQHLLKYIPEYGRWDDLLVFIDTPLSNQAMEIINVQLHADLEAVKISKESGEFKPISLLGKWLPSINCSSGQQRYFAMRIIEYLGYTKAAYRKMLSVLRSHIKVVEKQMSHDQWDQIDYSAVPSKANMIYADAFMKHDPERRQAFLDALVRGETKINAGTLFPHEILHQLNQLIIGLPEGNIPDDMQEDLANKIKLIEEMWKALPEVGTGGNVMMIRDGSRSMINNKVKGSDITLWEVATALTIYFSERMTGEFHNQFITFSRRPEIIDLNRCATLLEKLDYCRKYDDPYNTDIELVFRMILGTAVNHKTPPEDMPKCVVIVSDMEFDACCSDTDHYEEMRRGRDDETFCDPKLFEVLKRDYEADGYQLPKLVFWNINSRTEVIPLRENDLGVALISGYSVHNLNMIMSAKTDPWDVLVDQLMSERYEKIKWIQNYRPNVNWDGKTMSSFNDH